MYPSHHLSELILL
jgi:glycyl-tRNA synthetase